MISDPELGLPARRLATAEHKASSSQSLAVMCFASLLVFGNRQKSPSIEERTIP